MSRREPDDSEEKIADPSVGSGNVVGTLVDGGYDSISEDGDALFPS